MKDDPPHSWPTTTAPRHPHHRHPRRRVARPGDGRAGAAAAPGHDVSPRHRRRTAPQSSPARRTAYVYTRWGNPTVAAFERKAAALEHAEAALATASGMAAIASAILTIVKAGDHIVSASAIYPSTYHLMVTQLASLGIETTFVDATDPANVERAHPARDEARLPRDAGQSRC